jgi:hypothetical protein
MVANFVFDSTIDAYFLVNILPHYRQLHDNNIQQRPRSILHYMRQEKSDSIHPKCTFACL